MTKRELNNKDDFPMRKFSRTLGEVQQKFRRKIIDFADATKYYYSLGYDDRISYRREIVEKMLAVAKIDEEKKIALRYRI